jgi:hypothetical protein
MSNEFVNIAVIRKKFSDLMTLFNAGEIDGFLASFADDLTFALPMLDGQHDRDGAWGIGKAAFRDYVTLYRERHGQLTMVDVFGARASASVLAEDERGNRTEFCNEIGPTGLITRFFAFHVRPAATLA